MPQRCSFCGKTEKQHGGRACVDLSSFKRPNASRQLVAHRPGIKVVICSSKHPWAGSCGSLVSYEKYGLGWMGWRVALDNGSECYASNFEIEALTLKP